VSKPAIQWSDSAYAGLESALRRHSGLVFQPLRRSAVEAAASRVMRHIGIESPNDLVPLIEQAGAVFDDLMAEVTIGETYFFREQAHFTLLRGVIVPEFRERQLEGQRFRAWSAGCSTGEEPYSIALALREEGVPGTVIGTDVSRARLGAARRGEFREWSFRGVAATTIARYFQRDGDALVLGAAFRRDVEFRYLNLAADTYPAMSVGVWGMDVIFCRNVLIYFDRDTIAHVAESLMAALAQNGWLLLGATDPPLHEFVKCEVVQTDAGLAYRHSGGVARRPIDRPGTDAGLRPAARRPVEVAAPVAVAPRLRAPVEKTPAKADSGLTSALMVSGSAYRSDTPGEFYVRRDYDRVITLLAPSAHRGDAAATDFVLYIRALANLGRLDEAGQACAAAIDRHRDNAELYYLHAVLVAQSGQFAESALGAKRALYLDQTMIVAHLALASARARSDDPEGACRSFGTAERLLKVMPPEAPVPAADGEPAGRLLEMTRVQLRLVCPAGAA
jgi:chemotaxis protein methyltransferase CheR